MTTKRFTATQMRDTSKAAIARVFQDQGRSLTERHKSIATEMRFILVNEDHQKAAFAFEKEVGFPFFCRSNTISVDGGRHGTGLSIDSPTIEYLPKAFDSTTEFRDLLFPDCSNKAYFPHVYFSFECKDFMIVGSRHDSRLYGHSENIPPLIVEKIRNLFDDVSSLHSKAIDLYHSVYAILEGNRTPSRLKEVAPELLSIMETLSPHIQNTQMVNIAQISAVNDLLRKVA